MKYFLILLAMWSGSLFAEETNVGFLMNQKYVCINQGALINDKVVPMMSQEEAFRHPLRLYVDEENVLHTDGALKQLQHVEKTMYSDGENRIMLIVNDNRRYMMMTSKKLQNIPMLYICEETDNWTLTK